jgi:hypothetical protein
LAELFLTNADCTGLIAPFFIPLSPLNGGRVDL